MATSPHTVDRGSHRLDLISSVRSSKTAIRRKFLARSRLSKPCLSVRATERAARAYFQTRTRDELTDTQTRRRQTPRTSHGVHAEYLHLG